MSNKKLKALLACALFTVPWMVLPGVSAVGNGVPFAFREGFVPGADPHPVVADSLDFTYHSCVDVIDNGIIQETGYFWISSFQDVDSVVDSQINDFLANGYHIYGRYTFHAEQCGMQQTCHNATRLTYDIDAASLALYLDPQSDTTLSIQDCAVVANGVADDRFLGVANAIANMPVSMKSETNDLANGDFEIRFVNWVFSNDGQQLFRDGNNNPLAVPNLAFNGNVTLLGGPLFMNHRPSGSGNLYWID